MYVLHSIFFIRFTLTITSYTATLCTYSHYITGTHGFGGQQVRFGHKESRWRIRQPVKTQILGMGV